ncbi:M48 family metallopeptidase [Jeotgalibacillus proteolyticus]|uniref:Heat-shock protein HtpX n=1 Tax=Jeotgalibacillus proteolyticus TaxID=2082395 RepID=A0A2S5GBT5_9BACL|nr:M48 family metallopeptidase [Jeotgalibacillus proteolyticus]PPA70456.1 heat-shock protein HtpX [Jeotgalibacillus proteolyticus]
MNGAIKSERETVYFILSAIFSGIIYLIAAISIIGIGIALAVFAVVLFMNAMMLGSIRGNGVRISEKQFPDVYARVTELSEQMGLKAVPDMFVIQSEGALNAFATRFFGRNMVVLYSEVFELARQEGQDELDFIIAHELSHIKRRHVWKNILVMPAQFIPFLAQAYSRSCEYTCDREAAYTIQNVTAAKRALTILGIGKLTANEVSEDAYLEQIHSESNGAVWLSEVLSTHPRLPKRIQSVGQFMSPETTPLYQPNNGKIALGAGLLLGGMFAAYIAVILTFSVGGAVFASFLPDDFFEISNPPLIEAVAEGDREAVQELIDEGADLEETDEFGSTALMFTTYYGDVEMTRLLLDAGADPNAEDEYDTVLTSAINNGSYDIALLLYEYGALPDYENEYGESGFSLLGVTNETNFVRELESMQ